MLCARQQSVSQCQSVRRSAVSKESVSPAFSALAFAFRPLPPFQPGFFSPSHTRVDKISTRSLYFFSPCSPTSFPGAHTHPGNFTLFSLLCARLGLRKLLPVPKSESLPHCCAKNPLLLIYPLPPSALVALPLAIFGSRHSRSHPSLRPAQPPLAIRPRRLTSARPRRRWAALHHSLGKTPNHQ